jgi:hypothetical protein
MTNTIEEPQLTITITESIERTYSLTATELADLELPGTADAFENGMEDCDEIALALEEHFDGDYAVTERDIDIQDYDPS